MVKKKSKPPKSVPVSQNLDTSIQSSGKHGKSIKRQDSTDCFGDNIYESIEIDNNSPNLRKQSKKSKDKLQQEDKMRASLLSTSNSQAELVKCEGGGAASNIRDSNRLSVKESDYQNTPSADRKNAENIYQNTPTMKRKEQLELPMDQHSSVAKLKEQTSSSEDSDSNKEDDKQENCYTNVHVDISDNVPEPVTATVAEENIYIDIIADERNTDANEIYQNQNFDN